MVIKAINCSKGSANVIIGPTGQQKNHWNRGVFYEHHMLEYIAQRYNGGTFIDAGSSIGNHALFFAKFCNCNVISIEPIMTSLALQRKILELNGVIDKVKFVNAAIGAKNGYCNMFRFGPGVGHWKVMKGDKTEVRTLDSIVEKFGLTDVSLVKLDVEWSEIPALKGTLKLIESQHPAFFIESNTKEEIAQIKRILGKYKYRLTKSFRTNHEYRIN